MNSRSISETAQFLLSYLYARYGPEQVGLLRQFVGFQSFRTILVKGETHKLRGMLSFDKVLREQHGVVVKRANNGGNGVVVSVKGGGYDYTATDDYFGTVSRAVSAHLRSNYLDLARSAPSPVIQLGTGVTVSTAAFVDAGIDIPTVISVANCIKPDRFHAAINDNHAALVSGEPLAAYNLFEAISDCFTALRLGETTYDDPEDLGSPLPFTSSAEELLLVLDGELALSVQGPIKTRRLEQLLDVHPTGKLVGEDFILYQQNPYKCISSVHVNVRPAQDRKEVSVPLEQRANVNECTGVQEVPKCSEDQGTPVGSVVQDAIALVIAYHSRDLNRLSPDEKVIAQFGTEEGETAWEKVSKPRRKAVWDGVCGYNANGKPILSGKLKPADAITRTANNLECLTNGLDKRQLYLLAAGRIVSSKGNWTVRGDEWVKK